ncbi:hypothetical protein EVAR_62002_1 [Eumeta japonica]|uniref:Uncharacterized protein n=1 Tax=Eumeta variegata TaxID=151549 RepID=A0A4C1YJL0_EUMVA|nr:hypothetical protein EVAR_62002_1 [Eumeta japonica]
MQQQSRDLQSIDRGFHPTGLSIGRKTAILSISNQTVRSVCACVELFSSRPECRTCAGALLTPRLRPEVPNDRSPAASDSRAGLINPAKAGAAGRRLSGSPRRT